MRRVLVVLALVMVALSIAASASPIQISNQFGSIFFNSAGFNSVGVQVTQFGTMVGSPLGRLHFSAGPCLSGCNASGIPTGTATFSSTGSVFDIVCAGGAGSPCGKAGAPLFTGAFTGTVTLTENPPVKGSLSFTLTGTIKGMLANGTTVTGTTTQNIFTTAHQLGLGTAHLNQGGGNLAVPEPGTLGLLGTGLVGIAGLLRRKILNA